MPFLVQFGKSLLLLLRGSVGPMLFGVGRTVVPPAMVYIWNSLYRDCPLGPMHHIAQDRPDLGCEGPVTVRHHCALVGRMGLPARCSCKIELLALRLWPNRFVFLGSPYLGYCC